MNLSTVIAITDRQREWIENLDEIHIAAQLLSERECGIAVRTSTICLCVKENLDLYGFGDAIFIPLPKMAKAMCDRYQCSRGYHYHDLRDRITDEDLTACVELFRETVDGYLPSQENYVPKS